MHVRPGVRKLGQLLPVPVGGLAMIATRWRCQPLTDTCLYPDFARRDREIYRSFAKKTSTCPHPFFSQTHTNLLIEENEETTHRFPKHWSASPKKKNVCPRNYISPHVLPKTNWKILVTILAASSDFYCTSFINPWIISKKKVLLQKHFKILLPAHSCGLISLIFLMTTLTN